MRKPTTIVHIGLDATATIIVLVRFFAAIM